jgi:hypothetical protein
VAIIHVRGEGGAVMYFGDDAALPEGIAHRLERGDLVRVNPDGSPFGDAAPEITDEKPPDAPALPSVRENRAAWTEFAVSQGMDHGQAAAMSKTQLVEEFTKLRAVS